MQPFHSILLTLAGLAATSSLVRASLPDLPVAQDEPAGWELPPFSRYEVILDRHPFGKPPLAPPEAPPPAPVPEGPSRADQEKLARQINMSGVTINPDGRVFIGFSDLSVKPPVNYYLGVGASGGGWTVLDADYNEETATIEKEGVEIQLKLGSGLIAAASPEEPRSPTRDTARARRSARASTPEDPDPSADRPSRTATEQLVGMIASVPLGMTPPPLPMIEDGELTADAQKALETPIVIHPDDSERYVAHKEDVAWIKEDLRQQLESGETTDAAAYIRQLHDRQQEAAQQRLAEAERLRQMGEVAAREQVLRELASINRKLEAAGIMLIDEGEVLATESQ